MHGLACECPNNKNISHRGLTDWSLAFLFATTVAVEIFLVRIFMMGATVGVVMVVVQVCFFLQYWQGNENPINKHQRDQIDGATNSHSHEGRSRSEFGEHSFFFIFGRSYNSSFKIKNNHDAAINSARARGVLLQHYYFAVATAAPTL